MIISTSEEISNEWSNHPVWDKDIDDFKWVSVESLLEKAKKIRKHLINNSNCECKIATDKYANMLDALLWDELREHISD